jgi:exosortase A
VESLPQLETGLGSDRARRPEAPTSQPAPAAEPTVSPVRSPAPPLWLRAPLLAAVAGALGIVLVHWDTAASIVSIWVRSETFAHGFLVVPLCAWLIYRKRERLARTAARPWWPGLVGVLGAGSLWFVMSVADVLGLAQFGLAFMVQAAIVTVVGLRVSRVLLFPLAFLLFAIPVGEIFVPTLIEWTADFTIAALRASGVPVYREANHFVIPSGMWSVVEACSGIRYIIASVMTGTIYAAVAYRSTRRRVLFLAASIITPIVANWLRAYMIVMLGHLSNNKIAVGVDHLIYGWAFFGLVMLLLFWIGSFWVEDAEPLAASGSTGTVGKGEVTAGPESARPARLAAAALACILCAGIWVPLEAFVAKKGGQDAPVMAPLRAVDGWEPLSTPFADWKPHYSGFSWEERLAFRKRDHEIGLYVAYYRGQRKGHELVTSGNQLTWMGDIVWKQISSTSDSVEWAGVNIPAKRAQILGPSQQLDVIRLFWVDGQVTASMYVAKALMTWSRLTGRGDDAALIVVYAPRRSTAQEAAATIKDFAQAVSPDIERALNEVRASSR